MYTLEKVCLQLRGYLGQNESANAAELARVKQVLVDVFGVVDENDEEQLAHNLNANLN